MHGEHEQVPADGPAGLPPFSARYPGTPSRSPGGDRPLPPWSSEGRTLGGEPEEAAEAGEEPSWTAEEAEPLAEAGEEAPPPPAAVLDAFADEPWPGLEPEEASEAPATEAGGEPWAALPQAGEDPWASRPAGEAESEPWAAASPAETSEPWATAGAEAGAESEPWTSEEAEPEPLVLDEAEQAGSWESEASPEPAQHAPSPLDELVDVAGEALSGANAWTETPLGTWPGEAEAWDTVALTGEPAVEPDAEDGEIAEIAEIVDALERLAADVRDRGEAALDPASHASLDAALASFIAGWRAARRRG